MFFSGAESPEALPSCIVGMIPWWAVIFASFQVLDLMLGSAASMILVSSGLTFLSAASTCGASACWDSGR